LPDTFTGGKNSFLIQGSVELVPDTIVKVEIKDAKGNVIYTEPGEGIPEYYEGVSKPIAVYVYPDTAYGACTITILGELDRYDDNGIVKPVPTEWKDKYNVRWQKTILVNPNLPNSSKIRFYRRPKVEITETILPVYTRSIVRETMSGSVYGIAVSPTPNSNLRTYKGNTIYEIYATASIFSSSMEGESISVTNLNQSYTSPITDVVNDKKLIVSVPYYETSSNSPTSPQIVKNFISGTFELPYNKAVSFLSSSLNTSYAKIKLTDLEAFSGDPARLKIFAKRKADIGNYTLLEDIQLESKEVLSADFYSGSVAVDTGLFSSQLLIDDFWVYSNYSRSTTYSKTFDNFSLASSVKLEDLGTKNSTVYPQKIFYYSQSLEFTKDTEYELDFNPLLSSSLYTPNKIEVFLSGSAFFDNDPQLRLGKRILKLENSGDVKRYDLQQINFKPDSDGVGYLLFAVHQGNWHLSNIGLRTSQQTNFSPNEITLNVSLPTVVNNDEYEFKFEFYDINNNYVPVVVTKDYTFVGGSNLSNVNVSASFLSVRPESNVFPFGYLNNYDFQEVNTFAAVPIGSNQITFNVIKTGLTGNVLFTSAAYDSGGVYINPSNYSALSLPYPGLLSDITTDTPYLMVDNFTGSISTIEVKRIEYTAELEGFQDIVSIYKVVEGTPGSDGTNGIQYVIRPLTGTAIKNSNPSSYLELQLTKIDGENNVYDITSGNVKLVTGSLNTVIEAGNGIIAGTNGANYNPKIYAQKINGSLTVGAYDFDQNVLVDTITLADVTDGLTTGFIEADRGLILNRDPNTNTYTPTATAFSASFYDSLGAIYSASLLITPNYSSVDQLKYQTGYSHPSIALEYVKTNAGVSMTSNNTFYNATGLTAKYNFTEPNTGVKVSAIESVVVTTNGSSGTNGAAGSSGTSGKVGANAVTIDISPASQVVNVTPGSPASFGTPIAFNVTVTENGAPLTHMSGTPGPSDTGKFTIESLSTTVGNITGGSGTTSVSITPTTPTTTAGTTVTFTITYRDSKGTLSSAISQTHKVTVAINGDTGPGVVFTGIWDVTRAYQYTSTRRDVVLWSSTGNEPYDTYYIAKEAVSSGGGAPNVNTTQWESLGTEDYFVAAKIAIFEESFVKNTINIGTAVASGVSSANITLQGSGSYPYISIGQGDSLAGQGYGLDGIFVGAVKDTLDSDKRKYRMSLVTGSNFLKWDGDGRLLISGTVSASEGRIGGVTISGNTIYAGQGTYANSNTGFYLTSASANIFSLGDKLTWDGSTLNIKGKIDFGSQGSGVNLAPLVWKYDPYDGAGISSTNYGNMTLNGTAAQNAVTYNTDPFGNQSLVWQCYPDSLNSADGGWNSTSFKIDTSKSYKFVTYIKRYQSVASTSDGYSYWGTQGYNSSGTNIGLIRLSDGATDTDPNFAVFVPPRKDVWYLVVGYVFGKDKPTTATVLGGVWDTETGQYVTTGAYLTKYDYKWQSSNTSTNHRSYLYYNTTGNGSTLYQEMWGAAVYEMDGNEPDLNKLLDKGKILAAGSASFSDLGNTFISADTIYSPNIAGNNGYISNKFQVGSGGNPIVLDATTSTRKIYVGTGNYANSSDTPFYVDGDGKFSLKNKLTWDGSALTVNGTITITNPSTANNGGPVGSFSNGDSLTAGSIGGVTIGSDKIYIGAGNYGLTDTAFLVDNTGRLSLKDRLTWDGSLLFISGTVSASAGAIGGVFIDKSRLYLGDGIFSGSTTPFFVSSSGRFSLGENVTYEPLTKKLKLSGSLSIQGADDFSLDVAGLYISASRKLIKLGTSNEIIISGSSGGSPDGPKMILGTREQTKVLSGNMSTLTDLGLVGNTISYGSLGYTQTTQGSFVARYVGASTSTLYTTQPTYAQSISVTNSPLKFGGALRLTTVIGDGSPTNTQVTYKVGLWRITSGGTATEIRSTTRTALPESSNGAVILFNPFTATVNLFDHTSDTDNFFWKIEFIILTGGPSPLPTCGFSTLDFGKIYTTEPYSEYASNGMQVASSADEFFVVQPSAAGKSTTVTSLADSSVFCEIQSSNDYALWVTGNAGKSTGPSWSTTSDIRVKENIIQLNESESFDMVNKLNPVRFNYKKDFVNETRDRIGFIAQDYKNVFPQAIKGNASGLLAIDNDDISGLHSAAIKYLLQRLQKLEMQVYGSSSIAISGSI
jgi:hypothetical protein